MTTETMHIRGPVDMHGNALTGVTGVPTSRADVYANRGAAASYSGNYFFATDDPVASSGSLYYSDGTNWILIASPRGELGRTTMTTTTNGTTSTAAIDITSFSLHLVLATARAVSLRLSGPVQSTTADEIRAQIVNVTSSSTVCRQTIPAAAVTANVDTRVDLSAPVDLAAGTWDFKVQLQSPNSGISKFVLGTGGGTGTFYAYLQAVLL